MSRASKQSGLPCEYCSCMQEGDGYAVVGINDVTEHNFIMGHPMWGDDHHGSAVTHG